MWKEKIKHRKEEKRKEKKTHTEMEKRLILLLAIGDKWEIL